MRPKVIISGERLLSWRKRVGQHGIKELGGKNSTRCTAEQTEIAHFWEATLPSTYHGIGTLCRQPPEREVTQNARWFGAVTRATDDALMIASRFPHR